MKIARLAARENGACSGRGAQMKTIGLQIAIGLAIAFGSATASAETLRTPVYQSVDSVEQQLSSRHRHSHRQIRVHKRFLVYSSYPRAPWHSRDYFPRYYHYPPVPISVVYRY
jgi:hypothetical protein